MEKTVKEIAKELIDSEYNNSGIRFDAIQASCNKYGLRFQVLYEEIIRQKEEN